MSLDDFCSQGYRDVLTETHRANGMRWGGAGKSHAETISRFARQLGAKSILDYGCGRSTLKDAISLPVAEYDPGIPCFATLPKPADLLVCTDVLEHIEPDKLDKVIQHLRALTKKGAFLVIALTPAKLTLTDGRNAHISLHPSKWWLKKLTLAGFKINDMSTRKGLWVWAVPSNKLLARVHHMLNYGP